MTNPFFTLGYGGPEYFCDREVETAKLVEALTNGRNVALISPRRLGKTGLIHHTFHQLTNDDDSRRCFSRRLRRWRRCFYGFTVMW